MLREIARKIKTIFMGMFLYVSILFHGSGLV